MNQDTPEKDADTPEKAVSQDTPLPGGTAPGGHSGLVAAALAVDALSEHYRVQMTPAQARRFAFSAESGDHIAPARLARLIDEIDRAIPPLQFGAGNPNTGLPAHAYLVGNEGSRVLYVHYVMCSAPPGFRFDRLAETLERLARDAGADEYRAHQGAEVFLYRIWFD